MSERRLFWTRLCAMVVGLCLFGLMLSACASQRKEEAERLARKGQDDKARQRNIDDFFARSGATLLSCDGRGYAWYCDGIFERHPIRVNCSPKRCYWDHDTLDPWSRGTSVNVQVQR